MATIINYLDRYLEPVSSVLTPDLAKKIVSLTPDAELTAHIAELGEKANSGMLSEDELAEYKDLVDAGDLIALLKAKARGYLASHPSQ